MTATMTHRQRIFALLDGKPTDRTPWFPDLHYWLKVRRIQGNLPEKYAFLAGGDLWERLPELHSHPAVDAGLPRHVYGDFLRESYANCEIVTEDEDAETLRTEMRTPVGTLTSRKRKGAPWESPFRVEYPVKSVEDFEVIEYMLRDRRVEADFDAARRLLEWVGEGGTIQLVLPRSPLPRIIHDYMGLSAGVMAIFDSPGECERLMAVIEECDAHAFEVIGECPGRLVIFGDNVDNMSVSPDLYGRYSLPYYRRKCQFLHAHGKTVLCHMDGRLQGLLPLVRDTGIDVLDGITPEPMNDFSVEELAACLGPDQFAWAGVPSSMFCAAATREEVVDCAKKLIDLLGEKLILNVGDQLPPDADMALVEAVTAVVNG